MEKIQNTNPNLDTKPTEYAEPTEYTEEDFKIPQSEEVRKWEEQNSLPDVDEDVAVTEIEGGEKTNEDLFKESTDQTPEVPGLEGFSIVDAANNDEVVDEDHDELPDDLKDQLGNPDDEVK